MKVLISSIIIVIIAININEFRKSGNFPDRSTYKQSSIVPLGKFFDSQDEFEFNKRLANAELKSGVFDNNIVIEEKRFYSETCSLGQNEAIRTYVEFTDGKNRGMYDSIMRTGGFPDEDYDATTAMVINWHSMPELNPDQNARLKYRQEHPELSSWEVIEGESYLFWHRKEHINRVILTGLQPNSVYAYRVKDEGNTYRFRTMPANLKQRPIKIVMTGDLQSPTWNTYAHDNAKMTALIHPDMFVALGDYVYCSGGVTPTNADRWALYLDYLYNTETGYFLYETTIDGSTFSNLIIPHVAILGNHETGNQQHIRWPTCVITSMSSPGYPKFTAANWMELLFYFPFKSEGFYCEFRPNHPNIDQRHVHQGFGHGGFGALSFADYLLLIGLDNSQNWEGKPDQGLRDWEGNLITDTWPWFSTHHADVRQDIWLQNLLEPKDCKTAGERYKHIIPFWHRGLFGSARINMSLKNRALMEYWLPILFRNGVKYFGEGHDHLYGRSIPMGITTEQPLNTYIEKVYYKPQSWSLTPNLLQSYIDEFYAVNCLKENQNHEIVGWEYKGHYISYDPEGMRAFGYGGWAASRRKIGSRGAGNAGWWFVDENKGGMNLDGIESYHINVIYLYSDSLVTEAIHPSQLTNLENGIEPQRIHHIAYNKITNSWNDIFPNSASDSIFNP
jgi:hypothetical protein